MIGAAISLIFVLILTALPLILGGGALFGVIIPYLAILTFLVFFSMRIVRWAKAPVPFPITTTGGQQKSLSFIKRNPLEAPSNRFETVLRMALEILAFRSLFRNTRAELRDTPSGARLVYGSNKFLWAAGLAFHWSFLIIFLRHYRFFADPVPAPVGWLEWADGFFQILLPTLYISDILLLSALTFLVLRRFTPQLRYLSQPADWFPLFLLLAIGVTGALMRYTPLKVPIKEVKDLAMGLVTLQPTIPDASMPLFYAHLFLVSVLIAYFPFSKLMHLGGVFLTPTRNLPNNSREQRHVNPWNPEVKKHSFSEWQEEYRPMIEGAGIPIDEDCAPRQPDAASDASDDAGHNAQG